MTAEEFFMYLIIGLVILVPIGARLYRRMTLARTTQMVHEQLHRPTGPSSPTPPGPPQ